MRYKEIKPNDAVNGEGICVSLWTVGCPHHCKGCHNSDLWEYNQGEKFTLDTYTKIMKLLKANGVNRNLSILGGEPLCKENRYDVIFLCSLIKTASPETKIYVWTGYSYEYVIENCSDLLKYIDVLIDGKFEIDKKDIRLKLRGSSNQRIIDVKKSLAVEKVILYKY